MTFLRWIILAPITLIAIIFAVANRGVVRFELWPLPFSADLPLYVAVLGVFVLGLALGLGFAWMAGHSKRVMARREHRRAVMLEHEVAGLRTQLDQAKAATAPGTSLIASEKSDALPAPATSLPPPV